MRMTLALALMVGGLMAGNPITIDGLFNDWDSVMVAYTDGAQDTEEWDFGILKVTNDDKFLFLYFTLRDAEQLIQDGNTLRLYIDADSDPATGYGVHGLGAELEWCFGCRSGVHHQSGTTNTLHQNDISLRTAPTITSQAFEVAISRSCDALTAFGSREAVSIRLLLVGAESGGDLLPDDDGGLQYTFDPQPVEPPAPIPLARTNPDDIRLVTYNVLWGGLTDSVRQPHFQRILAALDPDIIAFQEQSGTVPEPSLIAGWLPGHQWYSSGQYHGELLVFSRFPILAEAAFIPSERVAAILLDTQQQLGTALLVLNAHFSCCSADDSRQQQADEFIAGLRDLYNGSGPFQVEPSTPWILAGDLNLVGDRQQLTTLTTGDINDQAAHGLDFPPDLDSTAAEDLFSRQTHARMGYTWRNDNSVFSPGKLDYFIYSESALAVGNHYVLNTLAMPDSTLAALQLELEDYSASGTAGFLAKIDFFHDALADRSDLEVREAYVDATIDRFWARFWSSQPDDVPSLEPLTRSTSARLSKHVAE
ncbi:MAG: endonuclease/exonuclease/phosphatase family protein [Candidatus Marinimicrobia bacterium]|nr:endonuclease/exonuclease/phosphatase family protein [Candidatus Neomarinimicrobiota bacterium]